MYCDPIIEPARSVQFPGERKSTITPAFSCATHARRHPNEAARALPQRRALARPALAPVGNDEASNAPATGRPRVVRSRHTCSHVLWLGYFALLPDTRARALHLVPRDSPQLGACAHVQIARRNVKRSLGNWDNARWQLRVQLRTCRWWCTVPAARNRR